MPGGQAFVYAWSMRNSVWTPAARYGPGNRLSPQIRPWADVAEKLDRINRAEQRSSSRSPVGQSGSHHEHAKQMKRRNDPMIATLHLVILAGLLTGSAATGATENALARAFADDCAAKAAAAEKAASMVVKGRDGWLFFDKELRHIGVGRFWGDAAPKASRTAKPEDADPLPAILDFKTQLDAAGIELIMMPVPPKAIVYPEMISDKIAPGSDGALPRLDPFHQEFYKLLQDNKIAVVDLVPPLMAARNDPAGPVFCKHDTHWSGRACIIAAKLIAQQVNYRLWLKGGKRLDLAPEERTLQIAGDLWKALGDPGVAGESLSLRFICANGQPVQPDKASPVVLMGDSHTLVFHTGGDDMLAAGAGLADQLAMELGRAVDVVGVRGSGATPARISFFRRSQADKTYLDAKKLVIWCFSAREFTESQGWRKVPIRPRSTE